LLAAVRVEAKRRGLPRFLLVCDEVSAAAAPFLAALGARYRSSEYRMVLDHTAIVRTSPRAAEVRLRPAGAEDAETLTRIQAASFGDALEHTRTRVTHGLRDPHRRYYLGELAGEPIGLLRVGDGAGQADITAFGVLPTHQGRGYGRQMLHDTVEMLRAEGWERVLIEVATDNRRALGLYQSCGFRVATAYGFYEMPS
jgi:ribosomal protein S18 acetylase RimI-like enzyme